MFDSTPLSLLHHLPVLPLDDQVLLVRLPGLALIRHRSPQIIGPHIPILDLSYVDAGKPSTADLLHRTAFHLLLSLDVVEDVAILVRIAGFLH